MTAHPTPYNTILYYLVPNNSLYHYISGGPPYNEQLWPAYLPFFTIVASLVLLPTHGLTPTAEDETFLLGKIIFVGNRRNFSCCRKYQEYRITATHCLTQTAEDVRFLLVKNIFVGNRLNLSCCRKYQEYRITARHCLTQTAEDEPDLSFAEISKKEVQSV